MKRKWFMALVFVAGVALLSLAADPSAGKLTPADTVRQLQTQITDLRAQVDALRQRAQTLESTVQELKQSHGPTPLILQNSAPTPSVPAAPGSHPPTVWGEREVNGWTFYIVPCEEKSR